MNTITIPTTQNIELEYGIAGLGDRILAFIIDFIVLGGYTLIAFRLLDGSVGLDVISYNFVIFLPVALYSLVTEIMFNGRTLGKFAMKLRVISMDGSNPSLSAYVIRWMLRTIDIWLSAGFAIPGAVALITASINKKGQRLGDIAAGTTVIKLKLITTFADTIFVDTQEDHQITFQQAKNLSDRDVSILNEVLNAGIKAHNKQLIQKLASKVKQVTQIETDMPDHQFLQTILKDYNHMYGRD